MTGFILWISVKGMTAQAGVRRLQGHARIFAGETGKHSGIDA